MITNRKYLCENCNQFQPATENQGDLVCTVCRWVIASYEHCQPETVGRLAYEAYQAALVAGGYLGQPPPPFDTITPVERQRWQNLALGALP